MTNSLIIFQLFNIFHNRAVGYVFKVEFHCWRTIFWDEVYTFMWGMFFDGYMEWRHQMKARSALLALREGFWWFFYIRLDKRLKGAWIRRWCDTTWRSCDVTVMIDSRDSFRYILQDCFIGTGVILTLSERHWSNPEGYCSNRPVQYRSKTRQSGNFKQCIFHITLQRVHGPTVAVYTMTYFLRQKSNHNDMISIL